MRKQTKIHNFQNKNSVTDDNAIEVSKIHEMREKKKNWKERSKQKTSFGVDRVSLRTLGRDTELLEELQLKEELQEEA